MKTYNQFITEAKTVGVPDFKTSEEMLSFILGLAGADKVGDNVMDPETGEVIMNKGEQKKKIFKKKSERVRWFEELEKYFVIKTASVAKVSGEDESSLADRDYDGSYIIPEKIKKKSGGKIDSDDLVLIQDYLDFEIDLPDNIKLSVAVGNPWAQISVMFK